MILILGRISINGSVKWLGVPDFHRNSGPSCTAHLLAPYSRWVDSGTTTNQNLGSQPGGYSGSVSVPWNCPIRVLLVYIRRISEICTPMHAIFCDNHLWSNRLDFMNSPYTRRNPIRNWQINQWDDDWEGQVDQYCCGEFLLVVSVSATFLFFLSLVWVATNVLLFGSLYA